MNVLERLKICASGGSIVPNRKLCGAAYDEIARLTAELAEARARIAVMMHPQARDPDGAAALEADRKRVRDEETRACIEAYPHGIGALTARLDQRKEAGE